MPKNNLALRLQAQLNAGIEIGEELGTQMMADLFIIALHRSFGFGPERIGRLADEVRKLMDRYHGHVGNVRDPDCDLYRVELDKLLKECVPPDRYAPFEKRYEALEQVRY